MAKGLPPAVRKASRLLSSSVLAQVAVLVATAVAASRLVPHDLSLYGAMTGASGILVTFSTLQSESRLPALDEKGAHTLVRTGLTANTLVLVATLLGGAVLQVLGSDWSAVLWIGGLCTFVLGLQRLLFALALREKRSELLARFRLVQGLSNAVLILVFVLFVPVPGYVGLGLGWTLSNAIGVAVMLRGWRPPAPLWAFTLKRRDWRAQWSEVGLQPLAALMAGGVGPMPLLLLPATGHAAVAGAWALCSRFLTPVVNTTFNTLQPLYVERASEEMRAERPDRGRRLHDRWALFLAIPSAVAVIGCYVVVVWCLPLLGPQWEVARTVVWPAIIYYVTLFWCLPLSFTLLLVGRKDLQMAWTVVRFVLAVVSFGTILFVDPRTALLLWAIASALTFLAQFAVNSGALRAAARSAGLPPRDGVTTSA